MKRPKTDQAKVTEPADNIMSVEATSKMRASVCLVFWKRGQGDGFCHSTTTSRMSHPRHFCHTRESGCLTMTPSSRMSHPRKRVSYLHTCPTLVTACRRARTSVQSGLQTMDWAESTHPSLKSVSCAMKRKTKEPICEVCGIAAPGLRSWRLSLQNLE